MSGKDPIERELGRQPLEHLMSERGLEPKDLVAASREQLTHKMVARACKGRRLTPNVQAKVLRALNRTGDEEYSLEQLFNY